VQNDQDFNNLWQFRTSALEQEPWGCDVMAGVQGEPACHIADRSGAGRLAQVRDIPSSDGAYLRHDKASGNRDRIDVLEADGGPQDRDGGLVSYLELDVLVDGELSALGQFNEGGATGDENSGDALEELHRAPAEADVSVGEEHVLPADRLGQVDKDVMAQCLRAAAPGLVHNLGGNVDTEAKNATPAGAWPAAPRVPPAKRPRASAATEALRMAMGEEPV